MSERDRQGMGSTPSRNTTRRKGILPCVVRGLLIVGPLCLLTKVLCCWLRDLGCLGLVLQRRQVLFYLSNKRGLQRQIHRGRQVFRYLLQSICRCYVRLQFGLHLRQLTAVLKVSCRRHVVKPSTSQLMTPFPHCDIMKCRQHIGRTCLTRRRHVISSVVLAPKADMSSDNIAS